MAMIIRRPAARSLGFRRPSNRFFDDAFARFFNDLNDWDWPVNYGANRVAVDLYENDDAFVVEVDLPGINPDDVDIAIERNILTIKSKTEHTTENGDEAKENGHNYHIRERYYSSFQRSFTLPTYVDAEATEANYENGTLTITLPKAAEAKPRHIEVKAS